jgi:signal transduction histidine kinase
VSGGQPAGPGIARLRAERARWESAWRGIRRLGLVMFISLFTVSAVLAQQGPRPGLAGRGLAVLALTIAALLAFTAVHVTLRRLGNPALAAAGVLIVSSAALAWVQPTGPGVAGVFTGVLLGALRLPWRWAAGCSAVTFAALVAVTAATDTSPAGTVAVLAFLGGFFGMVYFARRLADATGLAERLLAELERGRTMQARAAGLAERQRLAREMHDILAHTLSGLLLQLEGARMLAARDPAADPRLGEALDRAQHLGRVGLDETRQAIGMLRDDELPCPPRLAGLATLFSANRGVPCPLTVSGTERRLGADARLAVYRVAQEALTNVAKHARPERVEVRLAYLKESVRLTVEDFARADARPGLADNAARPALAGGGGYGLAGMRERAELIGGTLSAGVTPTGFRVELEVPE